MHLCVLHECEIEMFFDDRAGVRTEVDLTLI